MQSITVILSGKCARLLCLFIKTRPLRVFKLLQKGVADRSLVAIFEGSCDSNYFKESSNIISTDIVYMVLKIKFANAFQSANSESIWSCLRKFAYTEASKFSVVKHQNCQVILFDSDVMM